MLFIIIGALIAIGAFLSEVLKRKEQGKTGTELIVSALFSVRFLIGLILSIPFIYLGLTFISMSNVFDILD